MYVFFSEITYIKEEKAFLVLHMSVRIGTALDKKNSSIEILSFTHLLGGKDESLNPGLWL